MCIVFNVNKDITLLHNYSLKNITLTLNTFRLGQTRVYKQDFKVKGHNFKDKGQKGQNDSACPIRLICPKNMKQLSFIISEH